MAKYQLKSQNAKIPGTVYSTLTNVRDILPGLIRSREWKLAGWGVELVNIDLPKRKKENYQQEYLIHFADTRCRIEKIVK